MELFVCDFREKEPRELWPIRTGRPCRVDKLLNNRTELVGEVLIEFLDQFFLGHPLSLSVHPLVDDRLMDECAQFAVVINVPGRDQLR